MAIPKGWYVPLVIFAFFGHCATFIAAGGTDDILKQDLRITNIPEESVIDILNVLPEDHLRGLTRSDIDEKNYVYAIEDPSYVRAGIWLTVGDQRLYIMPQATDVSVKITDYKLTSEVTVRYAIGGGLYEQVFEESATSFLKQIFSSRCFTPRSHFYENVLRAAPEPAAPKPKQVASSDSEPTAKQQTPEPAAAKPKQVASSDSEPTAKQQTPEPAAAKQKQVTFSDSEPTVEPTRTQRPAQKSTQQTKPEPEPEPEPEQEPEPETKPEPKSSGSVGHITVSYDEAPDAKTKEPPAAVAPVEISTPDVDIELTSDVVSNYAESVQHFSINDHQILCASFANKDFRWNGMFLHGVKLPISRFSKEFTVCYADICNKTTNIVISAHIEATWIETYYQIVDRDSENLRLEPKNDMTFFQGFDELPGHTKPEVKPKLGEPYILTTENYDEAEGSPILLKREKETRFFSYKEDVEPGVDRKAFVQKIVCGRITYTLPENHTFFLLVMSRPFAKTYFATLFTKQGFLYIVHRWFGDSYNNLKPLPMTDPNNVAKTLTNFKKFVHSRSPGVVSASSQGSGGDGDTICLAVALSTTPLSPQSLCKSLESLQHTEVITNKDTFTILKYKANSPPGFAILGDAIIELNGRDTGSEITIHFEHSPEKPMTVVISVGDTDIRAMRETGVGTLSFEEVKDSMHNRSATSQNISINVTNFKLSENYGIKWEYKSLEQLWTLIPTKHPAFSIGNVTFHNCRVMPPPNNGYSFLVTPSKKDPDSLIVFYAYGDDASFALKLTKVMLAERPTCSVEALEHKRRAIGKADVDNMDFYNFFNTK